MTRCRRWLNEFRRANFFVNVLQRVSYPASRVDHWKRMLAEAPLRLD